MNDFSSDSEPFDSINFQTSNDLRPDPLLPGAHLSKRGWNYESTVAEVETIIHRIEMGELELADVFDQFAIAVEHLRHCQTFLTHQKQRMELLIETLSDMPETLS